MPIEKPPQSSALTSIVEHTTAHIYPPQEFDLIHAQTVQQVFRRHLALPAIERVVVRLEHVSFMDSTGLEAIEDGHYFALQHDKDFAVSNHGFAADRFRRLFEMTRLDKTLVFLPEDRHHWLQ